MLDYLLMDSCALLRETYLRILKAFGTKWCPLEGAILILLAVFAGQRCLFGESGNVGGDVRCGKGGGRAIGLTIISHKASHGNRNKVGNCADSLQPLAEQIDRLLVRIDLVGLA